MRRNTLKTLSCIKQMIQVDQVMHLFLVHWVLLNQGLKRGKRERMCSKLLMRFKVVGLGVELGNRG